MSLLQEAGVPVPKFGVAKSAAEARKIAEDRAPSREASKGEFNLFTIQMRWRQLPRV